MTVLGEPIDQGRDQMRVLKKGVPVAKTQIGGEEGGLFLVAPVHEGEEQPEVTYSSCFPTGVVLFDPTLPHRQATINMASRIRRANSFSQFRLQHLGGSPQRLARGLPHLSWP